MEQDWLFAMPRSELGDQEQILAKWLSADETAAAIADDEAESFVAVGYMLRFMDPGFAARVFPAFGVRISHSGEKARRRAILMVLRRWQEPKVRELLTWLTFNTGFGRYPDPAEQAAKWTDALFMDAYENGLNIVWLVHVRRYLHGSEDLLQWLRGLGESAEQYYRLWLNVGRITLSRMVHPAAEATRPRPEVQAQAAAALAVELREKDRLSGALRHDVRRLEQDRKQLKQQVRGAELGARAMLAQAHGEVAAARRGLMERQIVQEQELADQAQRFEAEQTRLWARIATARADFTRSLSDLAARSPFNVLQGRTVTVVGSAEDWEPYRLLVESIGGSLVPEGGDVVLPAVTGFAALERELRSLAMERVQIMCDGLYRRKEEHLGIAISGIQVHLGAARVYWHSGVVCCGPTAGSLMAEYGAAVMALSWILAADPTPRMKVEIWSDCRTLISRIRRERPPRRKLGCVMLHTTVRRLIRLLHKHGCDVRFRWVPRDEVYIVDRLCARTYRGLTWYHRKTGRPTARLKAFLRFTLQLKRYGPRHLLAEPWLQKDLESVI